MKVKFVYGVIPVLLIHAPLLVPERFAAMNYALFVAFKNSYSLEDIPLVQHELQHTKQFFRLPVLHPLLYALSKQYRYKSELEAYALQIRSYPIYQQPRLCAVFANSLYKNYNLQGYKTLEQILVDLKKAVAYG